MELLGCQQEQPVSTTIRRSKRVRTTTTRPAPLPPASPQCDKAGAAHCLSMSAKALETWMGFQNNDSQAGQSGCTPVPCLEKYTLDGCSDDEMVQLTSLQRANEAVRSAACGGRPKAVGDNNQRCIYWPLKTPALLGYPPCKACNGRHGGATAFWQGQTSRYKKAPQLLSGIGSS
ncbi:hypothetical protein MTO96_003853 [Rhipicephalus appendiculatus]